MTPNEYQALCLVTEFTPDFVRLEGATPEHNMMIARLLHAILGKMSETGELADMLKKHIIYGKAFDSINTMEEVGDDSWYSSLALAAIKVSVEQSMQANIAKLKTRYGDKFTAHAALNRDLDAERATLEGVEFPDPNSVVGRAMDPTND